MGFEYYSNLRERKDLSDTAFARGETMIHDDFVDAEGNDTNGESGRLTFAAPEPERDPTPDELDHKDLENKSRGGKDLTLPELNRLLQYKRII